VRLLLGGEAHRPTLFQQPRGHDPVGLFLFPPRFRDFRDTEQSRGLGAETAQKSLSFRISSIAAADLKKPAACASAPSTAAWKIPPSPVGSSSCVPTWCSARPGR
jgi:hypothetical protein